MKEETKDKFLCATHETDEKLLQDLKGNLEWEKEIQLLSNTFKSLADPTRLKIIYILSMLPLCVCDIANILGMTQSAISHQLRILRDMNLVKFKKEGKLVIYSLDDDHVLELFKQGLDHIRHD